MSGQATFDSLLQTQTAQPQESHFNYHNFMPQSGVSFDSSGQTYGAVSHTIPAGLHANSYMQARRPSQQDLVGSPASSYAPSLSDGRHGSISYQQATFKVPNGAPLDRRGSLPVSVTQNEQFLGTPGFAGQQGSPRDMHNSQWTPNFSFGGAATTNDQLQNVPETYKIAEFQAPANHLQSRLDANTSVNQLYNYDRRMSHPVLPTGSFDSHRVPQRMRQASAVDWSALNHANRHRRPSAAAELTNLGGSDGLWNGISSQNKPSSQQCKGKLRVAAALLTGLDEQFKAQMQRRRSMPFLPGHNMISEDSDQYEDFDGPGIFSNQSLDLSDDGSIPPQQTIGPDGNPDQASMMTTFNAKDINSGHKKHICPVCKKRFTRPSSLTTHIYSHTGEKPFICEVDGCGRHFSVISNLRRHKKIHAQSGDEAS